MANRYEFERGSCSEPIEATSLDAAVEIGRSMLADCGACVDCTDAMIALVSEWDENGVEVDCKGIARVINA